MRLIGQAFIDPNHPGRILIDAVSASGRHYQGVPLEQAVLSALRSDDSLRIQPQRDMEFIALPLNPPRRKRRKPARNRRAP
ncbi:MAG: hypothetical protein UY99_C0025G0004 [Parcubacteria group bacterium GW2011_GWA1_59_11]|nr:MAG: hypothetical protein UY99_C0025G0004 [Parcubacteria group bacterium GW2011_GWA1_59_11]